MKKQLFSILLSALLISSSAVPSAFALPTSIGFDFENLEVGSSASSLNITDDNGAKTVIDGVAAGTTVTVKNSDEIVSDNPKSNNFIKFDYNGNTGNETAGKVTVTPASPIKEDFTFMFDFALNCSNTGTGDYAAQYNSFMYITVMPNMQNDTANIWKYGSKILQVDQALNIKMPTSHTNSIAPSIWNGYTKIGSAKSENSDFATMKIVTRFRDGNYPVYDMYIKYPGADEFTVLATDRQYASVGYGNASLPASVYNDYGIKYIFVTMSTGDNANAQVAGNVFDAAIDNLRISEPETIILNPIYSDGMVVPKNNQFKIIGNGLDEGSKVSATIYNSSNQAVLSTSTKAKKDSTFELVFDDTSDMSEDDIYYIDIKSGNLSERINSVLYGNVVAFAGGEGYAEETDNVSMVYKDGKWHEPGEYSGYNYERTVAGNMSGIIVGVDDVATLPANCVVYNVSDENFADVDFEEYAEDIVAEGKKVIFRGILKDTELSAEDIFALENRLNNLSKKFYGDVFFVPVFDEENYADRLADVFSGKKELFNYWDINVNGNKVYLTLSDVPENIDASSFMCEDISGNVYTADSLNVDGKTIELTFESAETVIKLMYGNEKVENVIYSSDDMPLPKFSVEFLAKEKYNFKNSYDREKFISLFDAENCEIVTSGDELVITKNTGDDFSIERKNLYYSVDNVEIKLGIPGSENIRLFADDIAIFEGMISKDDTIVIERIEDKLYVNEQEISEDFSMIKNLKLEFLNCSEVTLNKFEISMPEYGKILELISEINNIPDSNDVKYTDKELIKSVYDKYVLVGGENVSYFTENQKAKMNELAKVLEKFISAELKMKENVLVDADIPKEYSGKQSNQKLTLTNKNSDVPYTMICIAAVYSADGKLIGISSENVSLEPGEKYEARLGFDLNDANSVDIYVLNNLSDGYTMYKMTDIPVK